MQPDLHIGARTLSPLASTKAVRPYSASSPIETEIVDQERINGSAAAGEADRINNT